jgi:RNA polymerase primary sigma factor
VPEKEAPETAPDSPLPDLSDAAVKKLTHSAKKRGYVTHDQINSVLPSEEVNSQEIEDVLADETEVIEPDERRQRNNGKDESTEPEMQNEGVRSSS